MKKTYVICPKCKIKQSSLLFSFLATNCKKCENTLKETTKELNSKKCSCCSKHRSNRKLYKGLCYDCFIESYNKDEFVKYKQSKQPKVIKLRETKQKKQKIIIDSISQESGIYLIENTINQKKYIGESSNLEKRKNNYINFDGYVNPLLRLDIEKYGIDNFTFTVLEYMPNSSKDQRLDKEAYYKSLYPFDQLYNLLEGREDQETYQKWKDQQSVSASNSSTQATTITESCF